MNLFHDAGKYPIYVEVTDMKSAWEKLSSGERAAPMRPPHSLCCHYADLC